MATQVKIKRRTADATAPAGLTAGEMAINLVDKKLYVGGTAGTNVIFLDSTSSVGLSTANTFTQLNTFSAGISASGATFSATTAATSSTTGAVIVAGGVGIAKDSFINSQRIGVGLLQDTTNLGVGVNALAATTAGGNHNTAIGSGCGQAITSGAENTLLGYAVGSLINTGGYNCSIGTTSLNQNQSGNFNTAMGYGALQNTTASNNTAVGIAALQNITTGALNTAVGREAGCFQANGVTALTTANNSVYLGRDTRGTQTDSNSVVIGYQAIGLGPNTTVIGTSSTTSTKVFGLLDLPSGLSAAGATFNGTVNIGTTALISAPSATALAIKSVVPAGTGVTPTIQVICPSSAIALTSSATAQNAFSPSAYDTITVQAATTYMFDGLYIIKTTGATTHIISMSFALTTATITNCTWTTISTPLAAPPVTPIRAQDTNFFAGVSGGNVNTSNTTAFNLVKFEGIMRVNATGGSVVPQITFSAAPGGTNTMEIGSYLRFYPIGSNTIDSVGTAIG